MRVRAFNGGNLRRTIRSPASSSSRSCCYCCIASGFNGIYFGPYLLLTAIAAAIHTYVHTRYVCRPLRYVRLMVLPLTVSARAHADAVNSLEHYSTYLRERTKIHSTAGTYALAVLRISNKNKRYRQGKQPRARELPGVVPCLA